MKFIVDAQLPKYLSDFIVSKGFNSIHTLELPDQNKTQDNLICRLAADEQRIVISKDADFLEWYLVKKEPPKLLIVKTGNIKNKELLEIFESQFNFVTELFSKHDLIELTRSEIIVHT